MKPRIRGIHIPRPCTEDWESMDRAGDQERYCSQCARCVTDFTVMRDREIIERVLTSEGRICGRFTQDQLERVNLRLRPDPQPSTWRSALLALAGIACTVPPATATALQPPVTETAAQVTPEDKPSQEPSPAQEQQTSTPPILKGRVLKESDGQPLGGVKVEIMEADLYTTTDTEGRFQIDLGLLADPPPQINVVFIWEDYQPLLLTLSTADVPPELTIRLQEEEILKEVITVGGVEPLFTSVHERLWRPLRLLEDRWRRSDRHRDTPGPLFPRPDG